MNKLSLKQVCSFIVLLLANDVASNELQPVVIAEVKENTNKQGHWLAGKIVPIYESEIAAAAEGRLEHVATVGSFVNKGDIIASIDKFEFEFKLTQAEKDLEQFKLKQEYATANMNRLIEVSNTKGISEDKLMSLKIQHEIMISQIEQIKSRIRYYKNLLARADLRAPFAGEISEIYKNKGESVELHQSIVKVISHRNTEIALTVSSELISNIPQNGQLNVKYNDTLSVANIRTKFVLSKTYNHAYEIRLTPPMNWRIGSLVLVQLPSSNSKSMVLPIDALNFKQDGVYVYRIDSQNTVEELPVIPLSFNGNEVLAKGDLSAKDRVIIRGNTNISLGRKITELEL